MGSNQERQELLKLYPTSDSWKDKVSKMSDRQVTAIYLRFKKEGKLAR